MVTNSGVMFSESSKLHYAVVDGSGEIKAGCSCGARITKKMWSYKEGGIPDCAEGRRRWKEDRRWEEDRVRQLMRFASEGSLGQECLSGVAVLSAYPRSWLSDAGIEVLDAWVEQAEALAGVDVEGLLQEWGGLFVLEVQQWVAGRVSADREWVVVCRRAAAAGVPIRVVSASACAVSSSTGGGCGSVPLWEV